MKIFVKILLIVLWLVLAAGAVVLMSFANQNHDQKSCTGLEIKMVAQAAEPLFTEYDLRQQLTRKFGKFEKKSIAEINLEEVIAFLRRKPEIDYADAHIAVEGKLVVEIIQCKPLVRLMTAGGESYYLDVNGKVLPSNPLYPARVLVASGDVNLPLAVGKNIFSKSGKRAGDKNSRSTLGNIHYLAGMMATDSAMNALVEQIYIRPGGDIWLATKAGSHIIVFGDTSNAAEKIENLKAFYKYGLTKTGWDRYKTINLTYRNQVVCTK